MHAADIIAALDKSGNKASKVADDLGVLPSTVSMVIHGNSKSKRIAKHISKVTGLSVKKLWPGKYEDIAA